MAEDVVPALLAQDLSPTFVRASAFVLGALFGSFFNVAIYRWPRDMSVVTPPSHCPSCGRAVPAYRNLPIIGFLWLRGRAACCGAKLSPRYLMVEVIGAVLAVAIAELTIVRAPETRELLPATLEAIALFGFGGGMVIATFVDLEWMEIPDEVSLPGAALGLATASLRASPGVEDAALGAGAAYLFVQVLFVWTYERIFGRRGMGEGDAKFLMMIGAFVGWKGAAFALVGGALQGLVVAAVTLAAGRSLPTSAPLPPQDGDSPGEAGPTPAGAPSGDEEERPAHGARGEDDVSLVRGSESGVEDDGRARLPFGPFLALGALEFLFFGDAIIEIWWSLVTPAS